MHILYQVYITKLHNITRWLIQTHSISSGNPAMPYSFPIRGMLMVLNSTTELSLLVQVL